MLKSCRWEEGVVFSQIVSGAIVRSAKQKFYVEFYVPTPHTTRLVPHQSTILETSTSMTSRTTGAVHTSC